MTQPTQAQIEAAIEAYGDTPTDYNRMRMKAALTAAAQVEETVDYVDLIGKREIEWRAAAEDHIDEIERLKAELAATIERCAQVALEQRCERGTPWDMACVAIAAAIRKLKDE